MVCLGNICRSPLAAGILKNIVRLRNEADKYFIDSAGTASYHIGALPDPRSRNVAVNHGFRLEHKARQITLDDFKTFDHILVMDKSNLANVLKLTQNSEERAKVQLITDFDPRVDRLEVVPDPYYGENAEFERVYDQLVICSEGFLSKRVSAKL